MDEEKQVKRVTFASGTTVVGRAICAAIGVDPDVVVGMMLILSAEDITFHLDLELVPWALKDVDWAALLHKPETDEG